MAAITSAPIWPTLLRKAQELNARHIRDLFAENPSRVADFTFTAPGIRADLSRQRIDTETLSLLLQLAHERNLAGQRAAMLTGAHINATEDRAVLHTALRLPRNAKLIVDGVDVVPQVHEVLDRAVSFAEAVRGGDWLGSTGKRIRNVVNIGIGGSDLGPVMAYEALKPFTDRSVNFRFISNVDASDLYEKLRDLVAEETLFIVASKTFTTQETMMNARSARTWLLESLDSDESVIARHFVAVSTDVDKVAQFGIDPANMFGFWDWVGGRYSMTSAIGLSTMIALGAEKFRELLSGFHEMDRHFEVAPAHANLPILMGLAGLWNRTLLGIESVAVLPYDQYLSRFPAYLQQLTMESNGKRVMLDGQEVPVQTGAVYWGEPGTNGQHSFYQLLHQGTALVACDVIATRRPNHSIGDHHRVLLSNALAQASVFAFGRTADEVRADGTEERLIPHQVMPGNRPVTVLAIESVTPFVLGALTALYEHIVFVQGALLGINSFDQWGVQLGKVVAGQIDAALTGTEVGELDLATQALVNWYKS